MHERILAALRLLRGGMNLGQRVLSRAVLGSLISFLAAGLLFAGVLYHLHGELLAESEKLGQSAADYTENFLETQAKEGVREVAVSRAHYLEEVMEDIRKDVKYMASCTQALPLGAALGEPLPDPTSRPVHSGEVYIHYGPKLRAAGIDGEMEGKIDAMSGAKVFLGPLAASYSDYDASLFVSPKEGYIICADTQRQGGWVEMTPEFLAAYEPEERPWYKRALQALGTGEPVFTDVYMGASGIPSLTCVMPYYRQGEFAGVVGIGCTMYNISDTVARAKVGETGFSFVLGSDGQVIFSGKDAGLLSAGAAGQDLRKSGNRELAAAARDMVEGKSGLAAVYLEDEGYYLAYAPMPSLGWSFASLVSQEEILSPALQVRDGTLRQVDEFDGAMVRVFLLLLLIMAVLLLLFLAGLFPKSARMAKSFSGPVYELEAGVKSIASGNFDARLGLSTGNELEKLAGDVNFMAGQLKKYTENLAYITAEQERIATELKLASGIQAGMLPNLSAFQGRQEYDLAASMDTAKEVGGDFFDVYLIDERHLALTIADVSGKGIGAALFMVVAKTVLKSTMLTAASAYAKGLEPDLGALMGEANRRLCQGNEENMFVTVFLAVLDVPTGKLSYVSAGHNPPLWGRQGSYEYLRQKRRSPMLAMIEETSYWEERLQLEPGDTLFLYTDGVTEALNEAGDFYLEERLQECLSSCREVSAAKLLAMVRRDVAGYVGSAPQSDDITMLALKFGQREGEPV